MTQAYRCCERAEINSEVSKILSLNGAMKNNFCKADYSFIGAHFSREHWQRARRHWTSERGHDPARSNLVDPTAVNSLRRHDFLRRRRDLCAAATLQIVIQIESDRDLLQHFERRI
jgi:hypothetical protein